MRSTPSQPRRPAPPAPALMSLFILLSLIAALLLLPMGTTVEAANGSAPAADNASSWLQFTAGALFAEGGLLQQFAIRPLLVALLLVLFLAPLAFYIGYRLGRGQGDER